MTREPCVAFCKCLASPREHPNVTPEIRRKGAASRRLTTPGGLMWQPTSEKRPALWAGRTNKSNYVRILRSPTDAPMKSSPRNPIRGIGLPVFGSVA